MNISCRHSMIGMTVYNKTEPMQLCLRALYMRYNIIIYKLQWFTGEGHKKGEAKYKKCKKRKNKYKIHANVVKKKVRKNRHWLGFF